MAAADRRNHRRGRRPAPGGMTMLELLLVLGILLALGAMAWPAYESMLASRRLVGDADEIRSQLREARRLALTDGIVYRWDRDDRGERCRVVPATDPLVGEPPVQPRIEESKDEPPAGERLQYELSPGVRVLDADEVDRLLDENEQAEQKTENAAAAAGSAVESSTPTSDSPSPADAAKLGGQDAWKTRFAFFPDGSSVDGSVLVLAPDRRAVEVRVVGLTGEVDVSEIRTMEKESETIRETK